MTDGNKNQKSEELLKKILKGQIDDIKVSELDTVIVGNKIPNEVLKYFVKEIRSQKLMDDTILVNVLLLLDEVVEKGLITKDTLKFIKENPDSMKKFIKS